MDQIKRIKDKLHLAGLVDRFRETFGSSSHQYFIDKPMSMNDVKAFEYKYEISLPSHYVDFMTQVGAANIDIGKEGRIAFAGPDYGVWDIRTMLHISKYITEEPLFDENVNKHTWEEKYNIDNISDEEYDDLSDKAYSGVLTISHTGCSGYMGLVLKGKNKGRIIWFSDEIEYAPSFCEEANFLDWYEAWLNRVISGKAFLSDYYFGKTEEELIERFLTVEKIHKDNHEYWKKVALSYLRGLKSLSDTALKVLWKAWAEEKNQNIRYYIFNILVKFDYANTIPALRELAKTDPIEFIRNIHLFAFSVLPDWNDVLLEMRKSSTDSSLIQYLDFVNINNE